MATEVGQKVKPALSLCGGGGKPAVVGTCTDTVSIAVCGFGEKTSLMSEFCVYVARQGSPLRLLFIAPAVDEYLVSFDASRKVLVLQERDGSVFRRELKCDDKKCDMACVFDKSAKIDPAVAKSFEALTQASSDEGVFFEGLYKLYRQAILGDLKARQIISALPSKVGSSNAERAEGVYQQAQHLERFISECGDGKTKAKRIQEREPEAGWP